MTSGARRGLVMAGLLLLALLSVLSHTPRGVAQSTDSLVYMDSAQHLLDGRGLSRTHYALDGSGIEPMTTWPPLYPLSLVPMLWLSQRADVPAQQILRIANGVLLGLTLLIFVAVLRVRVSLGNSVLLCAMLAALPSWQIVPVYVWSEMLFLPLALAAYWALDRYLGTPRHASYLLLCFAALGLATATRYVGLAFALAAGLAVIGLGSEPWRRRAVHLACGTGIYVLFLAPLLLRNRILSGAFSGADRGRPDSGLADDVALLGSLLEREFWNSPSATVLAVGTGIGLLVAVIRRHQTIPAAAYAGTTARRDLVLPALFLGSYFLFLLLARQVQVIDLDTRMLVVTPPFLLLFLGGVALRASVRSAVLVSGVVAVVSTVWLSNGYAIHRSLIENWREQAEPGRILGIHYPALSSRRFDVLRRASSAIPVESGALLLTDVRRPAIVAHFFPRANVRLIETGASGVALAAERLGQEGGLALLTQPQPLQTLATALGDSAQTLRISGSPHGPDLYMLRNGAQPQTEAEVQ